MKKAVCGLAACAAAVIGLLPEAAAQGTAPSLYTVANITVRAEAADAVQAKQQALQDAQTKGLRALLKRLTGFRLHDRLPQVEAAEVERYVTGLEVRNERFSGTAYIATFDVGFSTQGVKNLLNQFSLPYSEERGPEVLILPIYIESGAAKTADRNPWRQALSQVDLPHSLVPAKLAPTRQDITAELAAAYAANPAATLDTLKFQYKTQHIVLAIAELETGGESLKLRLMGADALGTFSLERKVKLQDAPQGLLTQIAAGIAHGTLQERWKLTRASAPVAAASGFSGGGLATVELTAQYSGLKEWQSIRQKLQQLPGLQNFEIRGVNPRAAEITLDFPGGAERLASMAAGQGLAFEDAGGRWVVKSR